MESSPWTGFSDAELAKIRQTDRENGCEGSNPGAKNLPAKSANGIRKLDVKKLKSEFKVIPIAKQYDRNPSLKITDSQRLSRTTTSESLNMPGKEQNGALRSGDEDSGIQCDCDEQESNPTYLHMNPTELKLEPISVKNGRALVDSHNCDSDPSSNSLQNLEIFEQRQKMFEEQNRKRRALLAKAIHERKRKTEAESEKLVFIQAELQRLDDLVSNDVAILRNHIEQASLDFTESQKRYEKAEKEFVEAKLELWKRLERKEHLTEHLCAIIEHNEMRKAQKLAELMHKLDMDLGIDDCEAMGMNLVLPQLSALNDMSTTRHSTMRVPVQSNSNCVSKLADAVEETNEQKVIEEKETGDTKTDTSGLPENISSTT